MPGNYIFYFVISPHTENREGQFNKGKRDDEKFCELCVGATIRFNIQTFMYDEKKSGTPLFPEGLEVIPEFSMVEITILPQAVKEEQQGYGMKVRFELILR